MSYEQLQKLPIEVGQSHQPSLSPVIRKKLEVNYTRYNTGDPQGIKKFLQSQRNTLPRNEFSPELIIADKSNFLSIGYRTKAGKDIPTKFFLHELLISEYGERRCILWYALEYSVGALDYIRLGKTQYVSMM